MNCMSVQQEKTYSKQQQRNHQAYQHNTTSRVGGLRSCLRGEIEVEEAESKIIEFC